MKIAVLISGGVDSSVALRLLKEQGHDLSAVYLKFWLEDELSYLSDCPWEEDLFYAEKVCQQAGVDLQVVPIQKIYWQRVISYALKEVQAGRTPNPDILCNNRIKFGYAMELLGDDFDKIATGHYAQLDFSGDEYYLKQSPDALKDQTYFLSHLTQAQLSKALFPVGHLTKAQVRKLAEDYDLPNKHRKDSQGLCFLGKVKFREFVKHHLGEKKGDLVEFETGEKIAEHKGFWFFTIGQRKDIRLSGGPWYVVAKNPAKNIVYVSKNYHVAEKPRDSFEVSGFNWFAGARPADVHMQVKLRHGVEFYDCAISWLSKRRAGVKIKGQDQGIAAGQFAVFYQGERCLGAGVIE